MKINESFTKKIFKNNEKIPCKFLKIIMKNLKIFDKKLKNSQKMLDEF